MTTKKDQPMQRVIWREGFSAMTTFERHLQTGVQVILLAVVVWVGTSVVELRQDMVRLKERDEYKTQLIEGLRSELARANETRYRIEDARKDFLRMENDIKAISERINEIVSGKRK